MVNWYYKDLTNWIYWGCDPEVGLNVVNLDCSYKKLNKLSKFKIFYNH